jgi:ABC-type polar amino acid transport system ATPase subunit
MRIDKGEVVVICGPSGSGKSTLIKCINGLEPFSKGTSRSTASRLVTLRPTYRSCARALAWCFRTLSSSRT